ncbi:MAG: prepilin-type N-terminal cleavage/methylation domain-containing protein [Verrucomicrobiales bacterium]|nr:prepilin-type N-terminal cleavage/methylation domain-containing protein [Verrucomicrobiales bacterium]
MTAPRRRIFHTSSPALCGGCLRVRREAFSLMELLVVLTVVGLLSALATPSLLTLKSSSLSAAGMEFSGFLNLCRSKAIAERTSIRVAIVTRTADADDAYRKYAGWEWDKTTDSYIQYSEWRFLPVSAVFENQVPGYVARSGYAQSEKSVIEGDYVMADGFQNEAEVISSDGQTLRIQYLTFSPSGRAYIEGGEKRNLIFVIRESLAGEAQSVDNWIQFTVDTLTGRARIFRP